MGNMVNSFHGIAPPARSKSRPPIGKPVNSRARPYRQIYSFQKVLPPSVSGSHLCGFPKFVMARFTTSARAVHRVDFLLSFWTPLFGYPHNILRVKTTSSQGDWRKALCHTSHIRIIRAPATAAFQIGLAERHVGLIKLGGAKPFLGLTKQGSVGIKDYQLRASATILPPSRGRDSADSTGHGAR